MSIYKLSWTLFNFWEIHVEVMMGNRDLELRREMGAGDGLFE